MSLIVAGLLLLIVCLPIVRAAYLLWWIEYRDEGQKSPLDD